MQSISNDSPKTTRQTTLQADNYPSGAKPKNRQYEHRKVDSSAAASASLSQTPSMAGDSCPQQTRIAQKSVVLTAGNKRQQPENRSNSISLDKLKSVVKKQNQKLENTRFTTLCIPHIDLMPLTDMHDEKSFSYSSIEGKEICISPQDFEQFEKFMDSYQENNDTLYGQLFLTKSSCGKMVLSLKTDSFRLCSLKIGKETAKEERCKAFLWWEKSLNYFSQQYLQGSNKLNELCKTPKEEDDIIISTEDYKELFSNSLKATKVFFYLSCIADLLIISYSQSKEYLKEVKGIWLNHAYEQCELLIKVICRVLIVAEQNVLDGSHPQKKEKSNAINRFIIESINNPENEIHQILEHYFNNFKLKNIEEINRFFIFSLIRNNTSNENREEAANLFKKIITSNDNDRFNTSSFIISVCCLAKQLLEIRKDTEELKTAYDLITELNQLENINSVIYKLESCLKEALKEIEEVLKKTKEKEETTKASGSTSTRQNHQTMIRMINYSLLPLNKLLKRTESIISKAEKKQSQYYNELKKMINEDTEDKRKTTRYKATGRTPSLKKEGATGKTYDPVQSDRKKTETTINQTSSQSTLQAPPLSIHPYIEQASLEFLTSKELSKEIEELLLMVIAENNLKDIADAHYALIDISQAALQFKIKRFIRHSSTNSVFIGQVDQGRDPSKQMVDKFKDAIKFYSANSPELIAHMQNLITRHDDFHDFCKLQKTLTDPIVDNLLQINQDIGKIKKDTMAIQHELTKMIEAYRGRMTILKHSGKLKKSNNAYTRDKIIEQDIMHIKIGLDSLKEFSKKLFEDLPCQYLETLELARQQIIASGSTATFSAASAANTST